MLAMPTRNRIKELLAIRGWSIYELADRTKMSYPQLYRLVRAEQIPKGTNYGTLQKVSKALEVPIDDLETKEE
jgi:DNA-binding Xre family transcriptional regulator